MIEDCAHALGASYQAKQLGTFGDAAFFSFGRDKIISSVFGGMAITNNKGLGKKITQYHEKLAFPSYFWIFQQLLHPFISSVSLRFFETFDIGKAILYLAQKLQLLSLPVYREEKSSIKPKTVGAEFASDSFSELFDSA